jgi:hypothetical protein
MRIRIRSPGYEEMKIMGTGGFCNGPEGFNSRFLEKNGMQQKGLKTSTGTVDGIQSRCIKRFHRNVCPVNYNILSRITTI